MTASSTWKVCANRKNRPVCANRKKRCEVPCYRCGTRQVDPEAGKSSPWRRGVVSEHQVLICPDCQPAALADLSRCARCGSAHLIRRLDQVECLDCRLTRDAEPEPAEHGGAGAPGNDLAAEVARALDKVLGRR